MIKPDVLVLTGSMRMNKYILSDRAADLASIFIYTEYKLLCSATQIPQAGNAEILKQKPQHSRLQLPTVQKSSHRSVHLFVFMIAFAVSHF